MRAVSARNVRKAKRGAAAASGGKAAGFATNLAESATSHSSARQRPSQHQSYASAGCRCNNALQASRTGSRRAGGRRAPCAGIK